MNSTCNANLLLRYGAIDRAEFHDAYTSMIRYDRAAKRARRASVTSLLLSSAQNCSAASYFFIIELIATRSSSCGIVIWKERMFPVENVRQSFTNMFIAHVKAAKGRLSVELLRTDTGNLRLS